MENIMETPTSTENRYVTLNTAVFSPKQNGSMLSITQSLIDDGQSFFCHPPIDATTREGILFRRPNILIPSFGMMMRPI